MEFVKNILRIVQFLWVLLLTALLGNIIASNNNGHESAINYALFATVLSWLAVIWGLASYFIRPLGSLAEGGLGSFIVLFLDGASFLFTFIAGIVLAAKIKGKSCSGDLSKKHSDNWIGFGSSNDEKRCREIQASTAFMWFLAATLAATFAMTLMGGGRPRRYGGGSTASSAPHMSQVGV